MAAKENVGLNEAFQVDEIIQFALSKGKHTTSYKYAFFQSILDTIETAQHNTEHYFLSFNTIAYRFTELYWDLVLHSHIKQMPTSAHYEMTKIERLLLNFYENSENKKYLTFPFSCQNTISQNKLINQVVSLIKKDVLDAFHKDTKGKLFSIDLLNDSITFLDDTYSVLCNKKSIYTAQNLDEWIKYIEKIN